MKFVDELSEKIKDNLAEYITKWLIIRQKDNQKITINSYLSEKDNIIKNKIWYRGQSKEIEQMFSNLEFDNTSFWSSSSSVENIRKIHTGLPSLIVNTLSNIVVSDFNGIDIKDEELRKLWEDIEEDNQFYKQLYDIVCKVLALGDGVIKINYDYNVSELPILEFVEADRVEYIYKNKRLKEIIFKSYYKKGNYTYTLLEIYGFGYIKYKIFNESKVELNFEEIKQEIEELKNINDIYYNDKSFMFAIPIKFWESNLFEGRGKSVFDGKDGSFDGLDEVVSQWVDAIRKGRIKTYIPTHLLPKNENGKMLGRNDYINTFIKLDTSQIISEEYQPKIEVSDPVIQTEKYLQTYITFLDLCLQGLIAPCTLGIDDNKINNNSLAQREKEKITLETRFAIIDSLTDCLKNIIRYTLKSYYLLIKNQLLDDFDIDIEFGEYASPSFESKVETLTKAAPGKMILRFIEIVDELYGDTKTEEEKQEIAKELERLNNFGEIELNDLYTEDVPVENIEEV
jgi:hypothetical protein